MKPITITATNFQSLPMDKKWEGLKDQQNHPSFTFQEFALPQNMIQQEVEPPAHVWDKIVSVLEEQDKRKKSAQVQSRTAPHMIKLNNQRTVILYAAVFMLLGAIVLSVF